MIRKYLIQYYIPLGGQVSIFGHHGSIHFRLVIKILLSLLGVRLLSTIIFALRGTQEIAQRILSVIVLFIYGYFILQFLNNYLDALISSDRGVTIFRRDGLLQYSVQQFERSTIELISFSQDTLSDKIRNKGDITISLDHGVSFRIEQMSNPQKIVDTLWSQKGLHAPTNHNDEEQEEENDHEDKFTILVETLGEVIKDYMGKGERHPHNNRFQ